MDLKNALGIAALALATGCTLTGPLDGTWLFQFDLGSVDVSADEGCDFDTGYYGGDYTVTGDSYSWGDITTTENGGVAAEVIGELLFGTHDKRSFTASTKLETNWNNDVFSSYTRSETTLAGSIDADVLSGTYVIEDEYDYGDGFACTTKTTQKFTAERARLPDSSNLVE